jgi:uncharacterized membrane protein
MKQRTRLLHLIQTALIAAIIFVVTYVIRIPMPFASGGYLNIGDAPLYIGAYLLGGPAGAIAGALGSAMSDLAAGYVTYVIPTAIIKGLMGLVCGILMNRSVTSPGDVGDSLDGGGSAKRCGLKRFVLASILGGAIMVGGYAVVEALFFNFNQAIASVMSNSIQWAGGVIAAAALFPAIRAAGRAFK